MPSLDPPVPIAALNQQLSSRIRVTFSHPIVAGSFDTFNWFARFNNTRRPMVGITSTGGPAIFCNYSTPVVDIGPDVISYRPPPFDILSNTARQVAAPAFEDFPVA